MEMPSTTRVPRTRQLFMIETMRVGIDTVDEVSTLGKRRLFGLMRQGVLAFMVSEVLAATGVALLNLVMTETLPEPGSWLLWVGVASPIASLIGVAVVIVGLLGLVAGMPTEVAREMASKLRQTLPRSSASQVGPASFAHQVDGRRTLHEIPRNRFPRYRTDGRSRDFRFDPEYPQYDPEYDARFDYPRAYPSPSSPYVVPPLALPSRFIPPSQPPARPARRFSV